MYLKTTPPPIPEPRDFPTAPPLVLDLAGVDALSAAGIGELVGLRSRLRASGGRLVLVNVGEHAQRAIEEARLTDALGVCGGVRRAARREGTHPADAVPGTLV